MLSNFLFNPRRSVESQETRSVLWLCYKVCIASCSKNGKIKIYTGPGCVSSSGERGVKFFHFPRDSTRYVCFHSSRDFPYSMYVVCTTCIRDERSWSRDLPYSMYMACTAYIRDERSWSRDFPYRLYMACTAYIYVDKNWSRVFLYSMYVACTAYICDEKSWSQYSTLHIPSLKYYRNSKTG
jgi:WD40 repeat protein